MSDEMEPKPETDRRIREMEQSVIAIGERLKAIEKRLDKLEPAVKTFPRGAMGRSSDAGA